jgi:hypothetical protein
MTSKLTRERLEKIKSWRETYGAGSNVMLPAEEAEELARMALAAMDSEPDCKERKLFCSTDTARMRKAITVSAGTDVAQPYRHAQPALVVEREPIAWLNDAYLARGVVDGEAGSEDAGPGYIPVYREAGPQPAPVVPDDVLDALQKVARIRLDMNDFDGDRRGIADCLGDAEEALIEVVNRRAAMLAAAQQPQNAPQNIPEFIPDCWCLTCRPVVLNDMRFVVCPDCGNKRCPRANDHRNACTGSNEPGQEGSAYPAAPQEDINALIPLVSRNEREGK